MEIKSREGKDKEQGNGLSRWESTYNRPTNSEQTQGKHLFTQHVHLGNYCPRKLLQLRTILPPPPLNDFKFRSIYSCIQKPTEGPTVDLVSKLEA